MKNKFGLTGKILLGLLLGSLFGLTVLKFLPNGFFRDKFLIDGVLNVVGNGFLAAIKMLVVPLVLVSLACGASSMGDAKKIGRIGGKTFIFYLTTTAIAISISIALALLLNPGVGLDLSSVVTQEPTIGESQSLSEIILNMIPTNIFSSMANANMLQIIVFALVFGVAMNLIGKKAEPIRNVLLSLNDVCMKMIDMIMHIAPYGVFALMATTFANTGFDAIFPLIKYLFVIILVLVIHAFVVYGSLLKIFTKLPLKPFLRKFRKIAAVTFSTSSSSASLPVALESMDELGVSRSVSSFTLPLGSTINMDGTSIMQGVAAIFIAQVYGCNLGLPEMLTIILTATLASVGTAGVPGVGIIMLSMVLESVGLPLEGIGLILGIDRIVDMFRTTVNVMGDCVCTMIISKSENEFDEEKYLEY